MKAYALSTPQLLLHSLLILQFKVSSPFQFKNDGWRIALNIGREPESKGGMSDEWAISGCRLPIVIKCDFLPDNKIVPKVSEVRFTAMGGELKYPIEPGTWSLSNDFAQRDLSLTFTFPDELIRRDVSLQGTVTCRGKAFTQFSLDAMNDEYYDAQKIRWGKTRDVDEIERRKDAPRKWNPEGVGNDGKKGAWERRYEEEGLLSGITKRTVLALAQRKELKRREKRPDLKDLSADCGPIPGVEGNVYIVREGTVTLRKGLWNDVVVGTWSAEPINNRPVSYY